MQLGTKMKLFPALLFAFLIRDATAIQWQNSDAVRYSLDCDFNGNDFRSQQSTSEQCGPLCNSINECSHFTWSKFEGGVCYLKKGPISESRAQAKDPGNFVCGYIRDRAGGGGGGQHIQYAIRAGQVPVRGVNLGGWLVVEHWINSKDALWDGVPDWAYNGGEMQTMNFLGHQVGDARFKTHWDTFITEQDIANIAQYSLNTVRVPIGWWILGYDNNDPSNKQEYKKFAPGGLYFLDRLVQEWAVKYNVAVLVDIHAAKGSQNGKDHSAPPDFGKLYWSQYQENIDNTVDVARFIAERYRHTPSFLGVELLNEPNEVDVTKLKQYYITAYNAIRSTGNDCLLVTSPILWEQNAGTASDWENFMPSPTYTNVWHDWHKYLIWGFEGQTADWIMNNGVSLVASDIAGWKGAPLIMGEWAIASPESAPFTDATLKQYAKKMITTMGAMGGGWTMWTWKQNDGTPRANGQGGWSMKALTKDCIIDPKWWDSTSTACP